jgi:peptidoglycan-N-acetylglucosamine deacetylase
MLEPLRQRWTRLPGIERLDAHAAVLTFDDGPDPDGTPLVLDALDELGVRATFFALGEHLIRDHATAHEVAERGHELGLHGFAHAAYDALSPDEATDDVARAVWAYETVLGVSPRWFRPPYGRLTEASLDACGAHGLEPVYWSALGIDWDPLPPADIAANVADAMAPGAIVLLHDSARFAPRDSVRPTADALALVAGSARQSGIELLPLGEVAG